MDCSVSHEAMLEKKTVARIKLQKRRRMHGVDRFIIIFVREMWIYSRQAQQVFGFVRVICI